MTKHLLLDLDDTLLINSMDTFAPAYFGALGKFLAPYVGPEIMLPALKAGTKAMIANTDPAKTLEDAFDAIFYPAVGKPKEELHPHISRFYLQEFPDLKPITQSIPSAVELVETAQNLGFTVSIATNPIFPLEAIEERLRWANLDPKHYAFGLVPSYSTFHFAKPNPAYYTEFLSKVHATPPQSYMVGNDREMDILPSMQAGLKAYHVNDQAILAVDGYHAGPLNRVISWLTDETLI